MTDLSDLIGRVIWFGVGFMLCAWLDRRRRDVS